VNPEEERPVIDLDEIGVPEPADAAEPAPEAETSDEPAGPDGEQEPEPAARPEAVAEAVPQEAEPGARQVEQESELLAGPEEPDEDPDLVAMDRSLPDLTEDLALESALEALLLVVDSPASEESLAETMDQSVARVSQALRAMAERFTERGSGIDLRRVGEGWRFYTRDTFAPFVEKLLLDGQRSKLTRAALETLAVIAYRQPVTRSRVAAVRGVNVDGVIRTLLARGLIEEAGTDPETGGTLYVTTELFLERLGLPSLNDLPAIAPLLPEVDAIDDI
jgi:segregation and condensation protein B